MTLIPITCHSPNNCYQHLLMPPIRERKPGTYIHWEWPLRLKTTPTKICFSFRVWVQWRFQRLCHSAWCHTLWWQTGHQAWVCGACPEAWGEGSPRFEKKDKTMKDKDGNIQCSNRRLTDANINKLQNYYGKAIRANIGKWVYETSLLGSVLPLLLPRRKSTTRLPP